MDKPDVPTNIVSSSPAVVNSDPDTAIEKPILLVARFDNHLVSTVVLSAGIVAALILFIVQSFEHPNVATFLVPLMFGSLIQVLLAFLKKTDTKCPKCQANIRVDQTGSSE